eukprot:6465602-Amphidinium_carterae.3
MGGGGCGWKLFSWEVEGIVNDLSSGRCCGNVVVKVGVDNGCGTLQCKGTLGGVSSEIAPSKVLAPNDYCA